MALVEWASGFEGYQGKYIGSAFGLSHTGVTMFRNPHVANRLHARQTERRWLWSQAQRSYKNVSPSWYPILTQCGQNNPHVNSRGEIKYPNRYHKWIQLAMFWLLITGELPQSVYGNASIPYSLGVNQLFVGLQRNSAGRPVLLSSYFQYIGEYDPPEGHVCLVYVSRPVSAGVTQFHGNWYFMGTAENIAGSYAAELFLTDIATAYNEGDNVLVQYHWIDYYRGFISSVQQERASIIPLI